MDASDRSRHIYGKTQSGKDALHSARGAVSSAARRLLILINGQRTLGDLSGILGAEGLEESLQELEAQGYVELVRHFPEFDESPEPVAAPPPFPEPVAAPPPLPATIGAVRAAPRRRRRAVLMVLAIMGLAIPVAIIAAAWPILWRGVERASEEAKAELARLLASPPAAEAGASAAPIAQPGAPPPPAIGSDRRPVSPRSGDHARPAAKAQPKPSPARQPANPAPEAAIKPEPPAPVPAPAPVTDDAASTSTLHVRSQVEPQLPQQAKDLGIKSGRVVVVLHVAPDGTVEAVELVSATPPQVYDRQMQQAFEKWTFDPPRVHGRMTVQVDVVPQD